MLTDPPSKTSSCRAVSRIIMTMVTWMTETRNRVESSAHTAMTKTPITIATENMATTDPVPAYMMAATAADRAVQEPMAMLTFPVANM